MKWRVMVALIGPDGTVGVQEIGGRAAVADYGPRMIGRTEEEGKHLLAPLQVHLVQAQAEDHGRRRDAASAVARSGPSKISAPGGGCRGAARWSSARRA